MDKMPPLLNMGRYGNVAILSLRHGYGRNVRQMLNQVYIRGHDSQDNVLNGVGHGLAVRRGADFFRE